MNSPILELLAGCGVDPAYLILALLILTLVMIVLYIRANRQIKALYRTYDRFMRGKDMESMEDTIMAQFDRIQELEQSDDEKRKQIREIRKNLETVYQKTGVVKYDAFRELSGNLSYAVALLDKQNCGILINSMYSREGSYSYIKEIKDGKSSINLSEEEQKALDLAVGGEIGQ